MSRLTKHLNNPYIIKNNHIFNVSKNLASNLLLSKQENIDFTLNVEPKELVLEIKQFGEKGRWHDPVRHHVLKIEKSDLCTITDQLRYGKVIDRAISVYHKDTVDSFLKDMEYDLDLSYLFDSMTPDTSLYLEKNGNYVELILNNIKTYTKLCFDMRNTKGEHEYDWGNYSIHEFNDESKFKDLYENKKIDLTNIATLEQLIRKFFRVSNKLMMNKELDTAIKNNAKKRIKRKRLTKKQVETINKLYKEILHDNKPKVRFKDLIEYYFNLTNREKRIFNACIKGVKLGIWEQYRNDTELYLQEVNYIPFKKIARNLKNTTKKLMLDVEYWGEDVEYWGDYQEYYKAKYYVKNKSIRHTPFTKKEQYDEFDFYYD